VSTRSVIARPTSEGGFHGAYCHNDGYPAHQGRILFNAVTGHFAAAAGAHQPRRQLAAGRRTGLDPAARLGRH
jgi:hypothetical protein